MLHYRVTARHSSLVGAARVEGAQDCFAVVIPVVQVHFGGRGPLVGGVGARRKAAEGQYRGGVFSAVGFGDGAQLGGCLQRNNIPRESTSFFLNRLEPSNQRFRVTKPAKDN